METNQRNSAGCIEFEVFTECGRRFIWSAHNLKYLLIELTEKGYRATQINEWKESA